MRTARINIEFSEDALFGDNLYRANRVESVKRFRDLVQGEVATLFLHASITVRCTDRDTVEVNGVDFGTEVNAVDDIVNRVWAAWEWLVYETE